MATALSTSQIDISWLDNSSDEDGFRIERSSSRDPWAQIATVGTGVTAFQDDGLKRNTSYSYRVRAFSATGNSAYSDTATAKTLKK